MTRKSWLLPLTTLMLVIPLSACVSTPYSQGHYSQNVSRNCGHSVGTSNCYYSPRIYPSPRYFFGFSSGDSHHGYSGHTYSNGHSSSGQYSGGHSGFSGHGGRHH